MQQTLQGPSHITRTWLLGSISLLLFTSFLIYLSSNSYWTTMRLAEQETASRAKLLALQAEQLLIGQQQLLTGLHLMTDVAPKANQPFSTEIRHLLKATQEKYPHLMDILIIDNGGAIIHWTGPGAPPKVRDRGYVTHHLDQEDPSPLYIGPPLLSSVHNQQWFFAISTADCLPDGSLDHVIVAIVDLALLSRVYRELQDGAQSAFLLASAKGEVYAREPYGRHHIGKMIPAIPQIFPEMGGRATYKMVSPIDGQDRIISGEVVSGYPMVAVVSFLVDDVFADWRRDLVLLIFFALGGIVAIIRITITLVAAQRRHYTLSITDPLTGLINRLHFMELALKEAERAMRYRRPLSLMMIDLDHFKAINDHYGHPAGDLVLQRFAEVMRGCCRHHDLIARYGGEEFIILLPETELEGARQTAEKIRTHTRDLAFSNEGLKGVEICCSIGVSLLHSDDDGLQALIGRSDKLLYQAKRRGRDQVVTDMASA